MVRAVAAVVVLLFITVSVAAQPNRSARYSVDGLSFSVPVEYRPIAGEGIDTPAGFFYDEQLDAVVFVASLEGKGADAKVTSAVQGIVSRTIAGPESGTFRWKRMFSPSAYNKFDRQRGEFWGYDGKTLVCFETHKLVFPSRSVLVGYAYLISEGKQAKTDMRIGLGSMTDTITIECSKWIARTITRAETGASAQK